MKILAGAALFSMVSCASIFDLPGAVGATRVLRDDSGTDLIGSPGVYTLVNLHPDEYRSRLYAVNYQQSGLLPMGSEVDLLELTARRLRFRVLKTGKEYSYLNHKAAAEPFERHLLRFFGREYDPEQVLGLGEVDQAGIRRGTVSLGMTKQGVINALGYPPKHVNPDLDALLWTYWKSRFNRMTVEFDQTGTVVGIRD